MKFLKQGVCLVLLGAGLAAVPASVAATAMPASGVASSKAGDQDLVQGMRDTARGPVTMSKQQATGQIGFARAASGGDLLPKVNGSGKAAAAAKADSYLASHGAAFGAGKGQLTRQKTEADQVGGWTATYSQSFRGIPVFGAMLRAHVNSDGALTSVNGYAAPKLNLSVDPRLSEADAGRTAVATVQADPPGGSDTDTSGLAARDTTLTIYRTGLPRGDAGVAVLAYVVEVSNGAAVRDKVFVDAQTGKVVNRYSLVNDALDRVLYESNPDSPPVWEEGDPFPGTLTADQQNLVLGTGESYWFFANAFGRDSYDDHGATMRTVNNDPTIACPNANWNGVTTNYCNGVTADDVVAHEWGHAYTDFTWDGIYQWQPGALNESYSDIWGETVDQINGRMDGDEGDITTKRTDELCSQHTPISVRVIINSPASIAKICNAGRAAFGPQLDHTGITDDVVLAQDPADAAGPITTDGCSPLTNAAAVAGNIALIDRGTCTFPVKVKNAQNAGAIAVIIGNTLGRGQFGPTGADATITIPSVGIGEPDRNRIVGALAGSPVNVTMKDSTSVLKSPSYRWLIGEDATAFGAAIRDMWSPTCLGHPGKVSDAEYHCTTDDGGGVHRNSGVPNHAYSLLVDGGVYNGVTVTGIGLDKAAAIYFHAMTQYQTPTTGFSDHADALEASCSDLIGEPINELTVEEDATPVPATPVAAPDCDEVTNAIAAVELRVDPVQCEFQPLLKQGAPSSLCGAGTTTNTVYKEAFEDGLIGWDKESEIVYPGGLSTPWLADATPPGGRTGGVARGVDDPDAGQCTEAAGDASSRDSITSPLITMPEGTNAPKLTFDHYIATEFGFDGGNVKVSVNEGAFGEIPTSAFVFNGYNATLQATNPMGGQAGFTGTDGGLVTGSWGTTIVDLAKLGIKAGDSVRLRFDMGRDGCGGADGWYVDNVTVTSCDVALVASNTTLKIKPRKHLDFRQDFRAKIKVTATGVAPAGKVKLFADGDRIGSGQLKNGKLVIKVARNLAPGTYKIVAEYKGSETVKPSSDSVKITITR